MLLIKNLSKSFGHVRAVNNISFQVEKGEVLGFLGPNGAGKTTTMRMITGFLPPSSGTAVIGGYDITQTPFEAKKLLGYLPENAPMYGDMTVWNYLAFIAEIRGFNGRRRRRQVDQTIELCRLEQVRHQTIGTLSKGYRQRACLAQALIHDPPLLVMDEPTDGLDPNQKAVVRAMIREMAPRKAIVVSTHILEEVEAICTRAVIICNGAIAAIGTPAELKARSLSYGAIELAFVTLPDNLKECLNTLRAMARFETRDSVVTIFPRDAARLFHEAMELLAANRNWPLTGVKTLDGRLDDVFSKLTLTQNLRLKSKPIV